MKDTKDIQLRNVINKINDINNNINEEDDLLIKEKDEDNFEDLFIEGKTNTFKLSMAKQFIYLDEHYILTIFIKLILGIIFIFVPLLLIIIFSLLDFSEKNNYIFFPCFISISIILGSLLVLLVIKIDEACQINGLLIYTWERKNIFKIVNSILNCLFLLWVLFLCENLIKWFNLLKEKVAQSNLASSPQLFNKGSYTQRILFILFFWDLEKDSDGEYIHKKLEFFEYEDSVFSEFHENIKSLFTPAILLGFYNLFKFIFIKNNKKILSFLLSLVILFISFFIMFYPIKDNDSKSTTETEPYFSNDDCKYIEFICYVLIISLLIIKSFFMHLKLIKKKYISFKKIKKSKTLTVISIFFFLINVSGYALLISVIIFLAFDKIDQNLAIEKYEEYWNLIFMALGLILLGYAFIFGHHIFDLIYYPIAYEISPHTLKNSFYINNSGTIIETKKAKFKFSQSQKQVNSFIHDN